MDAIRVAKVDRVLCSKAGSQSEGTLHLTAHHLIFKFNEPSTDEELWVPYPLISLVTRLPQTLQGFSPLAFRCRTFETFTFYFRRDSEAVDVFDSVRELTVTPSVEQLYAFFYQPNPPFDVNDGWSLYSPREEFARMGVGSRTKAWRFTDINKEYNFCPTYPCRLVVPAKISDAVLAYAAKYRSKSRVPALTYLHWSNNASITRSSQPMVGVTNSRSAQDERLVASIFQSHQAVDSPYSLSPGTRSRSSKSDRPVYGATLTNLIVDARPTVNAMVMTAKGAGTENMEYYKEGRKAYLGVENIHVMRDSLSKVVDALREADASFSSPGQDFSADDHVGSTPGILDRQALRKSSWLRHISGLLDGTLLIVRNVHINSSHVLIHCSDGWDRTAQLSSLSQLCLDPYYRTFRGFQILVEKDWLAFGHRFADRCGHLSSEKFFLAPSSSDGDAAQNFLTSVQNKFASQSHLKETSPVFHQFLECVRQLQRQFPARFEFNEKFLEQLHYHLYSCQFGTFLYNCERERRTSEEGSPPPCEVTKSVWDYFNSSTERSKFINQEYQSSLDDRESRIPNADMGVLLPNPKDVRFWHELYGRSDEDMNGRIVVSQGIGVEVVGPIDSAEDDPIVRPLPLSRSPSPAPPSNEPLPVPYKPRTAASRNPTIFAGQASVETLSPRVSPSMPDLSNRPITPQPISVRPSASTSMLTSQPEPNLIYESSSRSPPTPPRSPDRRPGPSIAFPSTVGMKSVWGKISSNATAAFSAVSDAYGEVTKELKVVSLNPERSSVAGSDQGGGELRTWESGDRRGSTINARNGLGFNDLSNEAAKISSVDLQNPWSNSGSTMPAPSLKLPLDVLSPIPVSSFKRGLSIPSSASQTPARQPSPLERPIIADVFSDSEPSKPSSNPLSSNVSYNTPLINNISSSFPPKSSVPQATSLPSSPAPSQTKPPANDWGDKGDPLGVGFS